MFGVSFLEIAMVALVALVVVGPQKLPGMMRTAGEWMAKLRRLTSDMRAQTGIDDILREEGIDGVQELRTLLKGQRSIRPSGPANLTRSDLESPPDPLDEFPVEGADAGGALPDDLVVKLSDDDADLSTKKEEAPGDPTVRDDDKVAVSSPPPALAPVPADT